MNKEYKSKVQDALKMVFENVETTVDNDIVLKNESSSFLHMYNQLERLSDAMDADSMKRQKSSYRISINRNFIHGKISLILWKYLKGYLKGKYVL